MLRVGRVIHLSPTNSRRAVIKAENVPPVGVKVTDGKGRARGFVFDIFGSASSTYVEIECTRDESNSDIIDQTLFFRLPHKNKKKGKGKRSK